VHQKSSIMKRHHITVPGIAVTTAGAVVFDYCLW
jgi:hypothetical protein